MNETAELEAVDAALRSGTASAGDPAERGLQELALAVRADAPPPDPGFTARLGERVEAGFPRPGKPRLRLPRPLAMGAAASAVAAVGVAAVLLTGSQDQADEPARSAAMPKSQAAPDAARAPSATAGTPTLAETPRRRVERSAQLTLAAPERRLDTVADGIQTVTARYRGYVQRSSLTTGRGTTTGGSFELRIPAARLQDALRDLAGLATVRSRTQSGDDVTGSFVSARDRLASLRAERRSLVRRLAAADGDSAAEALRRRLDLNAAQVNGQRAELRALRARTDYATVTLTLERKRESGGGGASHGSSTGTGAALDDAADTMIAAVNLVVRLLGYAIPLGLLAALLWLGARAARRRRREAALS